MPHISRSVRLAAHGSLEHISFGSVLDSRSSIRKLEPLAFGELGELLWHGARTRATSNDTSAWQHRAAASAGGLHPIELIVLHRGEPGVFRYEPVRHSLDKLGDVDTVQLEAARTKLTEIAPTAGGDFVVLLADHAKTEAMYENSRSLVWRDAGALMATLHLVATAMGLGMCQLGLLGHEVAAALCLPADFEAVGVVTIGRSSSHSI